MLSLCLQASYLFCASVFSFVNGHDNSIVVDCDNVTPLQSSCLENPMDGGAWWAAAHGVAKSRTRLSDFTFTFHCHALEKELATHSSVLAWRIPRTGAWWAAVSGVARSRTRLKRLSSSSSRLWQIVFSQDGWNNISHLMDPYSVNLLFSPKSWNLYLLPLTLGRTLWLLHPMKYKRNEVMWLSRS